MAAVGLALLGMVDPTAASWLVLVAPAADRPRDRADDAGHDAGRAERRRRTATSVRPRPPSRSCVRSARRAGVAAVGALITARFAARLAPGAADLLPGGVGALDRGEPRGPAARRCGTRSARRSAGRAPGVRFRRAAARRGLRAGHRSCRPARCARPRTSTRTSGHRQERTMTETLTRRSTAFVTAARRRRAATTWRSAGRQGRQPRGAGPRGLPVPDGVVITTDGLHRRRRAGGLAAAIARTCATGATGRRDPGGLRRRRDPGRTARRDPDARTRSSASGPVAVRSSATAEDLPGAAFAGQQDTYLNVVGDDARARRGAPVLGRRCGPSAPSPTAAGRGSTPAGVRIAVVVQRMVDAEFAGVLFTANPVSGDRDEVVVDASSGLGEAVVSGLVTPDHYVLDARRRGPRAASRAGARSWSAASTAAGSRTTPRRRGTGHAARRRSWPSWPTIGRAVAAHFGRPQDIEWAYAERRASGSSRPAR